jgi:hypothetical protein
VFEFAGTILNMIEGQVEYVNKKSFRKSMPPDYLCRPALSLSCEKNHSAIIDNHILGLQRR